MIIKAFAAARVFRFQDSIARSFCYHVGFKELSPRPFASCELCVANEACTVRSIDHGFRLARRAILRGNRWENFTAGFSACFICPGHFVADSNKLWWRESVMKKGGGYWGEWELSRILAPSSGPAAKHHVYHWKVEKSPCRWSKLVTLDRRWFGGKFYEQTINDELIDRLIDLHRSAEIRLIKAPRSGQNKVE
jgi:hypothetical protein